MSGFYAPLPYELLDPMRQQAARVAMQQNRLAMLAQQRQIAQEDALQGLAPALASTDAAKRMNALAMIAGTGNRGFAAAAPLLQSERENAPIQGILQSAFGGGGPAPSTPRLGGAIASPAALMPFFEEASRETGIPVPLLLAQAQQESGFDPNARGRAGEIGVMQIKPDTAQSPGFGMQPVDPATLADPRNNILFGARYQAARAAALNGGRPIDWTDPAQRARAWGAYNGGGDPNYAQNVEARLAGGGSAGGDGGPGAMPRNVSAAETVINQLIALGTPRALDRAAQIAQITQRESPSWSFQNLGGRMVAINSRNPTQRMDVGEAGNPRSEGITPAQAAAAVLTLGPRVANGSATPEERQLYAVAVGIWQSQGQQATVPDPNNPGATLQVVVPRPLPLGWPAPPPLGAPQSAPQATQAAPAPTATPADAAQPGPAQGGAAGVPIGASGMTAAPPSPDPNAPRVIAGPQPTPQAMEAARKLGSDAQNVQIAARRFAEQLERYRGATGLAAFNPRSADGARLQQAFEALKMALRGEAFANTGVLQPGENRMLDAILRNPSSFTGLFSSVDAGVAQLDELLGYVQDRVNAIRGDARLPPVAIGLRGGGNTGLRLRFNPSTGQLEPVS